jgi:monomeric isocitrate dehydrogenase
MNRTDLAPIGSSVIQLFHSAKMYSIRPLSAGMGFFHSASSFSIRPKSAKMADKSAPWQPCQEKIDAFKGQMCIVV